MNPYRLSSAGRERNPSVAGAARRLAPVMSGQRRSLAIALVATLVASGASLTAPYLIGRTVDVFIRTGDYAGVLRSAGLLTTCRTGPAVLHSLTPLGSTLLDAQAPAAVH